VGANDKHKDPLSGQLLECKCRPVFPPNDIAETDLKRWVAFPVDGEGMCSRCGRAPLKKSDQYLRALAHLMPGVKAVLITLNGDGTADIAIPQEIGARRAAEVMHAIGGDILYALTKPKGSGGVKA
jgi:hypothetical protein